MQECAADLSCVCACVCVLVCVCLGDRFKFSTSKERTVWQSENSIYETPSKSFVETKVDVMMQQG